MPKQRECQTNCASFYAKIAECAAYDCDKNRFAQSGGPVSKYVNNIAKIPEAAYFAKIQEPKKSIPYALFTSSMGQPKNRFKALIDVCMNGEQTTIDAAESIRLMANAYKKQNFAIDCRSYTKNAVMGAGIDKGFTLEACIAGCEGKEYSGKKKLR